MTAFLDGIEQGGGLTTVINKTLGSAATEFGDTIALVDGGVYEFVSTCEQNGAGTANFGWLFDSDEAGTNYLINDNIFTLESATDQVNYNQSDASFRAGTVGRLTTAGSFVSGKMSVQVYGTALLCVCFSNRPTEPTTAPSRFEIRRFIYDSGTLPTQIGILSSLATGIAAGSTIKGVRLF
jgi:hypothetical protein